MTTFWSGPPSDDGGYRPFGRVLPDPSEALQPLLPTGWFTNRASARRWFVYGPTGANTDGSAVLVGELVWLISDEWGVMPTGDDLAWGQTYSTAATALDALIAWWTTPGPASEPTT